MNKAKLILLAVIALPWAALSVAAVFQVMVYMRAGNWSDAIFEWVAVILCGVVGFGFLAMVVIRWKPQAWIDRQRARCPDQPWLWRIDWAAGRIEYSARGRMWLMWFLRILAGVWVGFSIPPLFWVIQEVVTKKNYRILPALLFPCIAAVLVFLAKIASAHWRKSGKSVFVMSSVPGIIGGVIAGTVEFQKPFQTDIEFQLQLKCIREITTGAGKNRSAKETTLWHRGKKARLNTGGRLPVEFQISPGVRETDMRRSNDEVIWRLDVEAPLPGMSYSASFEVPVFKKPSDRGNAKEDFVQRKT
jgi:hypothetical protein